MSWSTPVLTKFHKALGGNVLNFNVILGDLFAEFTAAIEGSLLTKHLLFLKNIFQSLRSSKILFLGVLAATFASIELYYLNKRRTRGKEIV